LLSVVHADCSCRGRSAIVTPELLPAIAAARESNERDAAALVLVVDGFRHGSVSE